MRYYKLVILGSGGVGKSALTVQYVQNKFIDYYDPTIEDSYRKAVVVEGENAILEILDTAGTEQFTSIRDLYLLNGEGFLLLFSLTSKNSALELLELYFQLIKVKNKLNIPVLLIGTKCDLIEQRQFNLDDIKLLKDKMNQIDYLETSSKLGFNIELAFTQLIKKINVLNPKKRKLHSVYYYN